jgi:hypothetical protein
MSSDDEIQDLTENSRPTRVRRKTFGFLATLNTNNRVLTPNSPEEQTYKKWLISVASKIFSKNNVMSCLQKIGDVGNNPEISIKTTLERGNKRSQLHLHSIIKVTVPITDGRLRINYHKFNQRVQEILGYKGAKVFFVPFQDNSANILEYINKDNLN